MKVRRKPPEWINWVSTLRQNWAILTAFVGVIGAAAVFPFRLTAAERRMDKVEQRQEESEKTQKALAEQTIAVYKWVEQQQQASEHEKELEQSAPDGYTWDEVNRQYVKTRRRWFQ